MNSPDSPPSSSGSTASSPARVFIDRWRDTAGNERANAQTFLNELCDLIGVDRPDGSGATDAFNDYVFERTVHDPRLEGRPRFIDLYKKDCFVLEAKQGVATKSTPTDPVERAMLDTAPKQTRTGHGVRGTQGWAAAITAARGQAEYYARLLPEWPPFLIVVDIGHVIELWADFSRTGKNYAHYPDASRFRITLD